LRGECSENLTKITTIDCGYAVTRELFLGLYFWIC
jgi:hypothetical protein